MPSAFIAVLVMVTAFGIACAVVPHFLARKGRATFLGTSRVPYPSNFKIRILRCLGVFIAIGTPTLAILNLHSRY